MIEVRISTMQEKDLPNHIDAMSSGTREWTMQAARGECGWVCSDCCMGEAHGMPDECYHGHQWCTDTIKRDKLAAMSEGNEPT